MSGRRAKGDAGRTTEPTAWGPIARFEPLLPAPSVGRVMTGSVGVVVPAYRPNTGNLAAYVAALDAELTAATIRIELDVPRPGVVGALADAPATVNAVPRRRGKGRAITEGFEALSTDVYCFADADGSTPAGSVAAVVAPVCAGEADLVVGSRRHPAARVTSHQTFVRRRLGDGFAWLARRLIEPALSDYQCGAKAIGAAAWEAVRGHLREPGFAWDVELVATAAALGRRVREVPVEWHDHPDSTVATAGTTLALARGLVRARHRAKCLHDDPLHRAIAAHGERRPALVGPDSKADGR